MLGHLITYLRHSLPRTEDSLSTLGEELERARAYLEILKIRMGERLRPADRGARMRSSLCRCPPMMLQTLVENAIKHGLEPRHGRRHGVDPRARASTAWLAVTVADDGQGFSAESGGTGIGLKNVRERLRLAYGDAASFSHRRQLPQRRGGDHHRARRRPRREARDA